jgi:hypothetical protein
MNNIRINGDSFEELIITLREIDDHEDLFVEIINDDGEVLVYDNGVFGVVSGPDHCWFDPDQLIDSQRELLYSTLVDHISRVVDNIIQEALDVE